MFQEWNKGKKTEDGGKRGKRRLVDLETKGTKTNAGTSVHENCKRGLGKE